MTPWSGGYVAGEGGLRFFQGLIKMRGVHPSHPPLLLSAAMLTGLLGAALGSGDMALMAGETDPVKVVTQLCEPSGAAPPSDAEMLGCYTRILGEIMQAQGATLGMRTLYQVAGAAPRFRDFCHVTVHRLGETMYTRLGNVSEAMALCQDGCAYGCQHAVLMAYLRELPQGELPALPRLCPSDPQQLDSLSHNHCAHGVGHGLEYYFKDVSHALSACTGFPLPFEQKRCTQGVFMEHAIDIMRTQAPSSAPESHLGLCRTVGSDLRNDCYYYLVHLVYWAAGGSDPALFAACEAVPLSDQRGCYRGIGRALGTQYIGQEEKLIRLCGSAQNARATDCLLGFTGILAGALGIDRGLSFCAKLPGEARIQCSQEVGRAIKLRWAAEDRITAECQKAGEGRYVQACVAAQFIPPEAPPQAP